LKQQGAKRAREAMAAENAAREARASIMQPSPFPVGAFLLQEITDLQTPMLPHANLDVFETLRRQIAENEAACAEIRTAYIEQQAAKSALKEAEAERKAKAKAKAPEEEKEDGAYACKICFKSKENFAAFHCGHMMCLDCANGVRRSSNKCPFCRKKVIDLRPVFI